jgi:hypothetical protein
LEERSLAQQERVRRFVVFFVPEGVSQSSFWPKSVQSSTSFELGESLSPLEPIRQHCSILKGFASGTGFHGEGVADMLTGGVDSPATTYAGKDFPAGVSLDRMLASFLQGGARFSSYDLGILSKKKKPGSIGFDSVDNPRNAVSDPLKAFDDLLAGLATPGGGSDPARLELERRLRQRQSILDEVSLELKELSCKLGSNGRTKLEIHAESIRGIERQIEGLLNQASPGPGVVAPERDVSLAGEDAYLDPANYAKVGKLQMDILLTALSIDATRVATLQWARSLPEFSPSIFVNGLQNKDIWHRISHDGPDSDSAAIVKWHAGQFAYFVEGLQARDLLEDTAVLWVSEMSTGAHGSTDIPYIIAGSGGGGFKTGHFFDAREDKERRYNNDLLATVATGLGVPIDRFGKQREGDKRSTKGVFSSILAV